MTVLFIIVLGVLVAVLWQRVDRLQQRLETLESQAEYAAQTLAEPVEPQPETAPAPIVEEAIAVEETSPEDIDDIADRAAPATQQAMAAERVEPDAEPTTAQEAIQPASFEDAVAEEEEAATQPAETFEQEGEDSFSTRPAFQFDFEDIFGRRLPIWAGGITLAVAGVFLVRYSIESGLLTPAIRVAMAFLFGLGLLGGAEWAYRNEAKVDDERVRQALAGAGIATLYAAFYLAGTQYGLIGQTAAFLGLAAVTAGAIGLSYRFGLPCAILGLVGGFAAPALVGSEEANLPLLALYLGLVTAGLTVTGNRQSRPWLSIAALVFGLGWGALMLLDGDPGTAEIVALGLYFIVLGALIPAFADTDRFERPVRLGSALVASVQLALLVDQGGYAPLAWGFYLLLGATLAVLAWSRPNLREMSAIAAVVSTILLAQWFDADPVPFALVTAAIAAIYPAVALVHIWREKPASVDIAQLAIIPAALAGVIYGTFGLFDGDAVEWQLALPTLALAALPIIGAWRLWDDEEPIKPAALSFIGAIMVFGAGLLVTPVWSAVIVAAVVFAILFFFAFKKREWPFQSALWVFAGISLIALLSSFEIFDELERLVGLEAETNWLKAGLRWGFALAPWVALAWSTAKGQYRHAAEIAATAIAYGLVAQYLPSQALAWAAALGSIALWVWLRPRLAAQITLLTIAAIWALEPVLIWFAAGVEAIAADPFYVRDAPSLIDAATRLAPLAMALAIVTIPGIKTTTERLDTRWLAAPLILIIGHILFKHLFAIETVTQFQTYGLAERSVWQALLLGLALVAARGIGSKVPPQPVTAMVIAFMALGHSLWFSGLLHNPLWDYQAVGPAPIANLALVAGTLAIGATLFLRERLPEIIRPVADGLVMVIASIFALALLRQIFAGSILVTTPMSASEDLLRSLLGIVLALVFLFIGKWREERSWRIGSLVIMLIAVAKVFVWDAAGLEGLLRIASFMALGFSLIGIGWVYARQLKLGGGNNRKAIT